MTKSQLWFRCVLMASLMGCEGEPEELEVATVAHADITDNWFYQCSLDPARTCANHRDANGDFVLDGVCDPCCANIGATENWDRDCNCFLPPAVAGGEEMTNQERIETGNAWDCNRNHIPDHCVANEGGTWCGDPTPAGWVDGWNVVRAGMGLAPLPANYDWRTNQCEPDGNGGFQKQDRGEGRFMPPADDLSARIPGRYATRFNNKKWDGAPGGAKFEELSFNTTTRALTAVSAYKSNGEGEAIDGRTEVQALTNPVPAAFARLTVEAKEMYWVGTTTPMPAWVDFQVKPTGQSSFGPEQTAFEHNPLVNGRRLVHDGDHDCIRLNAPSGTLRVSMKNYGTYAINITPSDGLNPNHAVTFNKYETLDTAFFDQGQNIAIEGANQTPLLCTVSPYVNPQTHVLASWDRSIEDGGAFLFGEVNSTNQMQYDDYQDLVTKIEPLTDIQPGVDAFDADGDDVPDECE